MLVLLKLVNQSDRVVFDGDAALTRFVGQQGIRRDAIAAGAFSGLNMAAGVRPVLDRIPHFAQLLSTTEDQDFGDLRLADGSGQPLGTAEFVNGLARLLGRPIARRAPGRKPTASTTGQLKLLQ